nr:hypothetical protein [Tanacetum cinerariifolium]
MADFPNQDSFWNLLNADTMGSDSTSNSQFPGFSSQAPMTPEQQAFLQTQQEAFLAKHIGEHRGKSIVPIRTKDLSDDDAYWIERKKAQIKAKLRTEMPMEPNNEDESDE